jgi:pyruvate formate lyase activating enzyme
MDRRLFLKYGAGSLGIMACSNCLGQIESENFPLISINGKYSCEPLFYEKTANGALCELCPNKCTVTEIRPGNCRTRYVRNGNFFCNAYGNPYYVKNEVPEEESLYHFMPAEKMLVIGTCGCNLTCLYCNVSAVSQVSPEDTRHQELFPEQAIQACQKDNIRVIAYGYTEPVVFYEYMFETAKLAHAKGIRNVFLSNGHINEVPLRKLAPFLDAAVIDVKAFTDATYKKLTGGSIFPVFNSLKILKEMNVWLEITHLLVPGWTDNFELLQKMCRWMADNGFTSTPLHFNQFLPAYQLAHLNKTGDASLLKAREIALKEGLKYVYTNSPKNSEFQNTFCPKCNNLLVERKASGIKTNKLKAGTCNQCGEKIEGIW